jgi:hypothetical protein
VVVLVTSEEFDQLYAKFLEAVGLYFDEVRRTGDVIHCCQPEQLSLQQLSQIQSQRLRENDAHQRFFGIRTRLIAAAQIGWENSKLTRRGQ